MQFPVITHKSDVAAGFDAAADSYDVMVALNPGYRGHLRRAAAALLDQVHTTEPVLLDLGCGTGLSTLELLDEAYARGMRPQVIGVDASPGMLAIARRRLGDRVRFVEARCERLPALGLPPADGVLACYLLRNVSELEPTLAGINAALRPSAPLVAQDYSIAGSASARLRWSLVHRAVITPLSAVVAPSRRGVYDYLHASVDEFTSVPGLCAQLRAAGFTATAARTVPGWQRGILHLIRAIKPATAYRNGFARKLPERNGHSRPNTDQVRNGAAADPGRLAVDIDTSTRGRV